MCNFKEISIIALISISIFIGGTWIVENVMPHEKEDTTITCTINKIDRKMIPCGKTYTYRYRVHTNELENYISSPKKITRELYREKENYIGKDIEVVETKSYNKKNELISTTYSIKED